MDCGRNRLLRMILRSKSTTMRNIGRNCGIFSPQLTATQLRTTPKQRPDRVTEHDHCRYDSYVCESQPQELRRGTTLRLFAYNTAPQETCFTPFCQVHGREVTTMLDVVLLPSGTEALAPSAEAARDLARCRILNKQKIHTCRYSGHHREVIYQSGD